jgi:hypothetical protein
VLEDPQGTNFGIGVSELDRDIPLKLILETDGEHTRDSLHYGRLSVGNMANSACHWTPILVNMTSHSFDWGTYPNLSSPGIRVESLAASFWMAISRFLYVLA